MEHATPLRLPARLESAAQRVRAAAGMAAEQTVDSLGLAALSTHGALQRDALLGAQYELNRKLALFGSAFNEALDTDVARQVGAITPSPGPAQRPCPSPTELVASWDTLSLVDDHEVELHLAADRFAREIGNICEWELREMDAYMASLLHFSGGQRDRNPLRAEVIAQALVRAVEVVAERPETRKVLCTEIGRMLSQKLRQTYTDIVDELRDAGIKPMGLSVRQTPTRQAPTGAPASSAPAPLSTTEADAGTSLSGEQQYPPLGSLGSAAAPFAQRSGQHRQDLSGRATVAGMPTLGQVDAGLMTLIRRLNESALAASAGRSHVDPGAGDAGAGHRAGSGMASAGSAPPADVGQPDDRAGTPNLILAHRDALRHLASGALDHRVIDVVGGLFDQILADTRVPPQIARLIARLQLPVLRAALGDPSFFSSRQHPVRRFVNRIASLGSAVDDFAGADGHALVQQVATLVQELVSGDFEQLSLYEQKLAALEAFVQAQSLATLRALQAGTDQLLERKESDLRLQQCFARQLDSALQDLPLQDYLRDFLATTWSRVIAAAELLGSDAGLAQARALRDTGRALVMSVQPKGTPALRQVFLRQLPALMKALNQGLDSIQCPDEIKREFFGRLLPAHADSLRGQPLSTLEQNLLSRQVETALGTPLPTLDALPPSPPVTATALAHSALDAGMFTPAEAQAIGLIDERSVDWQVSVDIDLGVASEPEITAVDIDIDGLPAPEPVEPTRGKSLADHVQIGFAYRMHLESQWQTVRLTHVSPGRTFFVFAHGSKRQRTLSLTYRMLSRLCEAGRLRALENAHLLERATARARRQLATLAPRKR